MLPALPSRKLRSFILLSLSIVTFLTFFHLYRDDIQSLESISTKLPPFNGEPLEYYKNGGEQAKSVGASTTVGSHHHEENKGTTTLGGFRKPEAMIPSSTLTTLKMQEQQNTHSTSKAYPAKSIVATSIEPHATSIAPKVPSGVVVAAVGLYSNLSWISEIQQPMWAVHRYNHDDPSPPPNTTFPVNKGNEAMMYLSYIVNNYDSLPDYSIFIHGHRLSWHQEGDMVDMINNLRFPALDQVGYVPLRCDWYPSCPREIRPINHDAVVWGPGVQRNETEAQISKVWKTFFDGERLPHTIASQCCAQFAVTRKAIRNRPKQEYERMRDWLVKTELINDVSGRVFEKLWAYIFTKEAIRCPPPQQCACEFFGQCSPRAWTLPPEGLQKWPDDYETIAPEDGRKKSEEQKEVKKNSTLAGRKVDEIYHR